MIDCNPSWRNALDAMPLRSALLADLAQAVSNSGSPDDAARYLLNLGQSVIDPAAKGVSPWPAYDRFIWDFERIARCWPIMEVARDAMEMPDEPNPLPSLARFVVDRLPSLWTGQLEGGWFAPVTRALVLAERSHDLVAGWMTDWRPTGSKDPYGMRRMAKHWLIAAVSIPA